ncbi:exo-alpha-sialidase [Verrucomicrobiaceae bacterium N1E253]|uniref:exo-alpha-sialidase n=1 Tax=Oceaniferula marina TaxID=2748318 RepID=A0A851GEJ9_9BACT|nr:sialidase family protein [Oceaniferula marina]NWK54141.1 exo-alpha-sialidase [Oceaniferula marina]
MRKYSLFTAVLLISTLSLSAKESEVKPDSSPVFQAKIDQLGSHQYQCYREPVTVKTNSGRVVVGVHAGNRLSWPERSGQDLVVRYSDDQGKTWSSLIVAAEHGNFSCQSHGLVYDAQKNRLMFLYVTYNWDYSSIKGRGYGATKDIYQQLHDEGKPAMSAYMVFSDDDGKTWSKPRDLSDMVGGDAHFGASEGRQLTVGKHAGRLVIAGGDKRNMNPTGKVINKIVGVWISDDHGKNWRFSEIETGFGMGMSCEARVSELSDGTLVYNARMSKANLGRMISFSKNGGETWSGTAVQKTLSSAKSNGCTMTLRDKDGKLTNTLWLSVPVGKLNNCTLFISEDGGETWLRKTQLVSGQHVKYSAMVQLDADTVGLFYETSHYKDIEYKRLSIPDLMK